MAGIAPRYTITKDDLNDPARLLPILQRLINHDYDLLDRISNPPPAPATATVPVVATATATATAPDLSPRIVSLEQAVSSLLTGGNQSALPAQRAAVPRTTALPPTATASDGDTTYFGGTLYIFNADTGLWEIPAPGDMMTTDTAQNPITGIKTFTAGQVFQGNDTFAGAEVFSNSVNITGKDLELNGARVQCFEFQIINTAGTLQHRFYGTGSGPYAGQSNYSSKIIGISGSLTNTPNVTSVVDFAAGAGINNAILSQLILNTGVQTDGDGVSLIAAATLNSTGTIVTMDPFNSNINVNGTTRKRLSVQFYNATTGANFDLTTANIAAGKSVSFRFLGFVF